MIRGGIALVTGFASVSVLPLLLLGIASGATAQVQPKALDRESLPSTFRHETAVVNGVRLHYVTGGNGPALVLIHGLPASWYEWRGILPALAERYRVIAPD